MILFLDTVSSLPEFSLIEDSKVIYVQKIVKNDQEKMSDHIFPSFIKLSSQFPIEKKLKHLIVNTGPGSYTALRIGISFLSGLSIAKNINLIGISCLDLFKNEIKKNEFSSTCIFIRSSNNQDFICLYENQKCEYQIHKYENNFKIKSYNLKKIFTNSNLPLDILDSSDIEYKKLSFQYLVLNNLENIIKNPEKNVINPIYISNNQILN